MNPEIKTAWLAALRGKEYKQAYGTLKETRHGETRHCCLGVLCDLHAKAKKGAWDEDNKFRYLGDFAFLPSAVRQWAGLARNNPDVEMDDGLHTLSSLNDAGYSFTHIADIIEQKL